MKYFKRISILMMALLFSAKINVFACNKQNIDLNQNNLRKELNLTLINMPNKKVIEVFNYNNSFIYLTEEDLNLMAKIVYAESKGEPYEGKIAVASVILNRVLSPEFPDSIKEVVFQPNAFSCVVNGEINEVPNEECFNAVYDAIKGNDPTNEALFFYNPSIATCSWMKEIEKTDSKSIGQHLFFNTK